MKNEDKKIVRELVITNSLGLHLRPVSLLVQKAMQFGAELTLENLETKVAGDMKSVTSLLAMACPAGTKVRLSASGADANEAADAIADLISRGFDED